VAGVACVAYSPNGERMATVGGDGVLRVWTVGETGAPTLLTRFEGQVKPGGGVYPLTGVAFAPDSQHVAAVGADAIVRIWDVLSKTETRSLLGHTDWVTAVAFSPDGRFLSSVGVEKDHALRIFELPSLDATAPGGHSPGAKAVSVSPDGKSAATAGKDGKIIVWDLASGRPSAVLVGNDETPYSLTFLGNDALVLGSGKKGTGSLHFWKIHPGRLTGSVTTGEVYTVVPGPDGTKFAAWMTRSAVGESIKNNYYELFDAKGKGLSKPVPDGKREVLAVTFTPDLEWVVTGDKQGNVIVWDLATGKPVGDPWAPFTNPFGDLGISPDRRHLVAADDRGLVKIADLTKREVIGSLSPHTSGVRSVVVSPTGKTFASLSNDREVKVWSLSPADLKQPKPLRTWSLPVDVNAATYTPDGKRLVTANGDGTAYVLELP
jgi:WD40 repeat protein